MNIVSKNRSSLTLIAKTIGVFAGSLLLPVICVAAPVAQVPLIKCDELRRLQLLRDSSLIIVDVRLPNEFAKGHIEGARDIPMSIVTANLPHEAKIVVYCAEPDCPLSTNAANSLAANGYPHVTLLEGGFNAWVTKHYPVQKSLSPELARPKIPSLTAHETRDRLTAGSIAIDVRPAAEFAAGHLPGARNIPLDTLDTALPTLSKDAQYVVYDREAPRMNRAAQKIQEAGLNVSKLSGGLADWVKKKYPLQMK